jgi:hypothetical protein
MSTPHSRSLSLSLHLVKALALARHGKIRDAELLLAAEGTVPEDSLALEAYAALVTTQGDYTRALRLWRLLLQREPAHAEARRMVDAIELWESRPAWFSFLPIGAAILAVVLIAGGLMWALSDSPAPAPRPRPAPVISPATSPAVNPPAAAQGENPTIKMPEPEAPKRRKTR